MTESEEQALALLKAENPSAFILKMTDLGNPDFLLIPPEAVRLIRFVESKAGFDTVKPHQLAKHEELRAAGLRVDILWLDEDGKPLAGPPVRPQRPQPIRATARQGDNWRRPCKPTDDWNEARQKRLEDAMLRAHGLV